MSLVTAVRQLCRMRLLVLLALILACVVGVAIPYRIPSLTSRQYQVGIASASALVDSTKSQVADLAGNTGSDVGTLAYRASLLASLMTNSPIKDEIAQRAGIPANELIATGPATVIGSDSPAPSVSGASVSQSNPKASSLSASVPTLPAGQIPVIQVNTQGPTPAIAANLANAAFVALQAEINSVAGTDNIPAIQRVVIRSLGPADAALASRGPGLLYGVLGAILAFVLACGAILGISSLRAALRNESALERAMLDLSEDSALERFQRGADGDPLTAGAGVHDPDAADDNDDLMLDIASHERQLAELRRSG